MRPVSTRLRQGISFSFLIAVFALAWTAVIQPLEAWKQGRFAARDSAYAELNRLQKSSANLRLEEAQLSRVGAPEIVWTAPEDGEAKALIQSKIDLLAREHGLLLRSVSPTSLRELPLANAFGFRVEAEASLDHAVSFFHALEYNTPALAVEQATLRRLNRSEPSHEQPALFLQLELIAPYQITKGLAQ